MRVLVAVAILMLLPTASAGQIVWQGPDGAYAGAPAFMAYTIEEGEGLEGHVNVRLEAWLDDTLILETDSVHEHDGAYPTVVSAPAPGTLRVVATRDGGEAARELEVYASTPANLTAAGLSAATSRFTPETPGDALALFEAVRADGNLVLSAWTRDEVMLLPYADPAAPQAIVAAPDAAGARLVTADAPPSYGPLVVGVGGPPESTDPCPPRVVTDPNSAGMGVLAWQAETNIRVMVMDAQAPITYTLTSGHPIGPDAPRDVQFQVTTAEPTATLTFRPGAVGPHLLGVAGDGVDCAIVFDVLPAPEERGTVEADIETRNGTLDVRFRAIGEDGAALGHYEFDTRVVRVEDDEPGRLVWAGKMHGHAGDVRFRLHALEPGTYEIVTYPSPQDTATPGVGAQGGYRYTAVIGPNDDAPWRAEADDPAPPAKDAPFPALGVVALLIAFVTGRRVVGRD